MPYGSGIRNTTRKPPFTPGMRVNQDHPLNQGLVAWWPLIQFSPQVLYDVVAARHLTAAPAGGIPFSGSDKGTSANLLNTVPDYYSAALVDIGYSPSHPLTLTCWYRPGSLSLDQPPIGLASTINSTSTSHWCICFKGSTAGDYVNARISTGAGAVASISAASFVLNTWYHAVAVYISNTSRFLYLDGVISPESTSDRNPAASVAYVSVGNVRNDFICTGRIADVSIYNRALSQTEVLGLYQSTYGTPDNPRLI